MKKIFKLVMVLISLFLSGILVEFGLRVYFWAAKKDINSFRPSFYFAGKMVSDKTRFSSHPFLPFFPRPGDSRIIHVYKPKIGRDVVYNYQNNSLGFRTPERPYEKPDNTKRIVTLGGSTTWDGPTNDMTWPAILERKLNDRYQSTGQKIEVINLAVDAANAQMSLGILQLFGLHYQPDLVISYDGANDVWFNIYCHDILPDYTNYLRAFNDRVWSLGLALPKPIFESYLVTLATSQIDQKVGLTAYLPEQIWRYTPAKSDKTLPTATPLYLKTMRLMQATCREFDCQFVASIPHWSEVDQGVIQFDQEVRNFFQKEGFNYLDLQLILPHRDYTIHVDSLHWTEKGLNLVAQEWEKKIVAENLIDLEATSAGQL